jgi:hypothetical protein
MAGKWRSTMQMMGQQALSMINSCADGSDFSALTTYGSTTQSQTSQTTQTTQPGPYESAIHLILKDTFPHSNCHCAECQKPKMRKKEIISRQRDAIRLFAQLVQRQRQTLQTIRGQIQSLVGSTTVSTISNALLTALGLSKLNDSTAWTTYQAPSGGFIGTSFGTVKVNSPTNAGDISPGNSTFTLATLTFINPQTNGSGTTIQQVILVLSSLQYPGLTVDLSLNLGDITISNSNQISFSASALANLIGTGIFVVGTPDLTAPNVITDIQTPLTVGTTYQIGLDPNGQWQISTLVILY